MLAEGQPAESLRSGWLSGRSIRNIASLHDVPTRQARNSSFDEQPCDDRRRTQAKSLWDDGPQATKELPGDDFQWTTIAPLSLEESGPKNRHGRKTKLAEVVLELSFGLQISESGGRIGAGGRAQCEALRAGLARDLRNLKRIVVVDLPECFCRSCLGLRRSERADDACDPPPVCINRKPGKIDQRIVQLGMLIQGATRRSDDPYDP